MTHLALAKQGMKATLVATAMAAAVGVAAATADAQVTSLTSETCEPCTEQQIARWDSVRKFSLGIAGRDVLGHDIGKSFAFRHGEAGNLSEIKWGAIDEQKHTLCGQFHHFGFHDNNAPEQDWNIWIIPSEPYRFLLQTGHDVADKWLLKCGGEACAEAEIDSHNSFWQNGFFHVLHDPPDSELIGQLICAYGPWVWDSGHSFKPEIHPSELLWWRDPGEDSVRYVMLIQDNSNRYDRDEHFIVVDKPSGWRPWAQVPLTEEILVAFQVSLPRALQRRTGAVVGSRSSPRGRGRLTWIDIEQLRERNVVTSSHPSIAQDAGPGWHYEIAYDGITVLAVAEEQSTDDGVGVRFAELCRLPATGKLGERLIGFVVLNSAIGANSAGGEGYQLLRITESTVDTTGKFAPPFDLDLRPRFWQLDPRLEILGPTLRRHGSALVVDIAFRPALTPGTPPKVRSAWLHMANRLDTLDVARDNAARVPRLSGADAVVLSGVPVTPGATALLELETGERYRVPMPALSLSSAVRAEHARDTQATPGVWQALSRSFTGSRPRAAPGELMRAREWMIEIQPRYAALSGDGPAPEETNVVAQALNVALDSAAGVPEDPRVRSLFGTTKPFSVKWTFRATNLTSGRRVPVRINQEAGTNEIRVDTGVGPPSENRLRIVFPQPSDTAYEVEAVGTVVDPYAVAGTLRHTVWSHFLVPGSSDSLAQAFIAAAPVPRPQGRAVVGAVHKPDRHARIVRGRAALAVLDKRVTIDELRGISRAASMTASRRK